MGESMQKTTEIRVKDMLSEPYTVKASMTIHQAIDLMRSKGLDFLSVTDESNALVGVLTENDLIKVVKHESPSLFAASVMWLDHVEKRDVNAPISDIMHTKFASISPDESIQTAFKIMHANNYKMLHVLDPKSRLLGVIRIRDVFKKLIEKTDS
jgi:CBS domain-containing protein